MHLIDGLPGDRIDVRDRGLQYGDGVFETIAVKRGRPRFWQWHMRRLEAGCQRLGIPFPGLRTLNEDAQRLSSTTDCGVLKLIVTRGSGGRGYRPDPDAKSRRIASLYPMPTYPSDPSEGVTIRQCATRLARNPVLAGIKHLNRLEQVLARSEWRDPDIAEGLMLDTEGNVIEGTMSNIFLVKGDSIMTPDLSHSGVAGIMRQWVGTQTEELGLRFQERLLVVGNVTGADEVFLTNSIIGIWPVRRFEGRTYDGFRVATALASRLERVETP